jgi:hypothetical protein
VLCFALDGARSPPNENANQLLRAIILPLAQINGSAAWPLEAARPRGALAHSGLSAAFAG